MAEDELFLAYVGMQWFGHTPGGTLQVLEELSGQWSGLPVISRRFGVSDGDNARTVITQTVSMGCARMRLYLQMEAAPRAPLASALRSMIERIAIDRKRVGRPQP